MDAPDQDSGSSTLAIPLTDLQRPRAINVPKPVPAADQAAQDAPNMATSSMPTQSHFDPLSAALEPSIGSGDSTASHYSGEENNTTPVGFPSSTQEVITHSRFSMIKRWICQRSWLQNTVALTMLALTLIGLFYYQNRSDTIATWAAKNDFMQLCIALAQLHNVTLSEPCGSVIVESCHYPDFN
ncbi:hypothetical protein MMC22_010897 [Lobaria immixta]|nr:hypothetical protein [Lobaria immixta]